MNRLLSPHAQLKFAWAVMAISIIGWILSMLLWARSEPPFILSLSWFALIYTALNTIVTMQVNINQTESDGGNCEAQAQFLFKLLDDIDTVSDMVKDDDQAYRKLVTEIQKWRFRVATTDGYTVKFKDRESE